MHIYYTVLLQKPITVDLRNKDKIKFVEIKDIENIFNIVNYLTPGST